MSLDVYLTLPALPARPARSAIFIRDGGATREISREEWDQRFPDREPVVVTLPEAPEGDDGAVYTSNITHNLAEMAVEARLYQALWRPEEAGLTSAWQLVEPLRTGLALLQSDRARFEAFNPANGWGDYDGLVSFVEGYLRACERYTEAKVSVSR